MYMDLLATEMLFGTKGNHIQAARYRDFSAEKPDVVFKYIETKYNELIKHNFVSRLEQLEQASVNTNPQFCRKDR